jgi:hypothetical protein
MVVAASGLLMLLGEQQDAPPKAAGEFAFTGKGEMVFPAQYREWVYLSSGWA